MNQREFFHDFLKNGGSHKRCGNVFAEGKTIYSYGKHYELAVLRGGILLVNAAKSTRSTERQKDELISKLLYNFRALDFVKVSDCDPGNVHTDFDKQLEEMKSKVFKARGNIHNYLDYLRHRDINSYLRNCWLLEVPPMPTDHIMDEIQNHPKIQSKLIKERLKHAAN